MSRTIIKAVYRIVCTVTNNSYVGASLNYLQRVRQHCYDFNHHTHPSKLLQADWDKYGKSCFVFSVLESVDDESVVDREQYWLDLLKPNGNTNTLAGSVIGDYIRTPEAKEKRRLKMVGRKHTEEHKRKISESLYKNPPNKGKKFDAERCAMMSDLMMGDKNPNFGKPRSDETRKKISISNMKSYSGIVAPDGTVYNNVKNLDGFCKEHGISRVSINRLFRGVIMTAKGWKVIKP